MAGGCESLSWSAQVWIQGGTTMVNPIIVDIMLWPLGCSLEQTNDLHLTEHKKAASKSAVTGLNKIKISSEQKRDPPITELIEMQDFNNTRCGASKA